jgi:hypothetical protein
MILVSREGSGRQGERSEDAQDGNNAHTNLLRLPYALESFQGQ